MKTENLHDLLEWFSSICDVVVQDESGKIYRVLGVRYLEPEDKDSHYVVIKVKGMNSE